LSSTPLQLLGVGVGGVVLVLGAAAPSCVQVFPG